jgi:putative mRNA 3-end processing factor
MRVRGARRRKSVDRGFVLSDHADWTAILNCIDATESSRIIVTHGNSVAIIRWLKEKGLNASAFETQYAGEAE